MGMSVTSIAVGGTVATIEPPVVQLPPIVVRRLSDLTLNVNETEYINLVPVFSDPEGATLTYTETETFPGTATIGTFAGGAWTTEASGRWLRIVAGSSAGTGTCTVTATDPTNLSVSDTFSVTVQLLVLAVPSVARTGSIDGQATIRVSSSDSDVTGIRYMIQRATSSTGPWSNVATIDGAGSYTDTGLTNGTTYWYRAKATAPNYTDSAYSQPFAVTPMPSLSLSLSVSPDEMVPGQTATATVVLSGGASGNATVAWSLLSTALGQTITPATDSGDQNEFTATYSGIDDLGTSTSVGNSIQVEVVRDGITENASASVQVSLPVITGPTNVDPGEEVEYSIPAIPGATYSWTQDVVGGTLQDPRDERTVTLVAATGANIRWGRVACTYTVNGESTTVRLRYDIDHPISATLDITTPPQQLTAGESLDIACEYTTTGDFNLRLRIRTDNGTLEGGTQSGDLSIIEETLFPAPASGTRTVTLETEATDSGTALVRFTAFNGQRTTSLDSDLVSITIVPP